jgi:hypothetical protein
MKGPPTRLNQNRPTPKHIIVKMSKVQMENPKNNEKSGKSYIREDQLDLYFSTETFTGQKRLE